MSYQDKEVKFSGTSNKIESVPLQVSDRLDVLRGEIVALENITCALMRRLEVVTGFAGLEDFPESENQLTPMVPLARDIQGLINQLKIQNFSLDKILNSLEI